VNSSACDSVRQEVRKAAADYIRQGLGDPLTELNPAYSREKSETLQLADATMTGQTQGTVEGLYNGVKDSVVGTATLLSDLFASAFGNTQAQLDLNAEGQGMYNFLKDPDNWPQLLGAMSAQEREQLALAYERGDGKKIGAATLLNMPMAGPAGVIKKIDKIADVAKVGDKVGDVPKGKGVSVAGAVNLAETQASLATKVADLRSGLPSNIKNSGNMGVAEIDIPGVPSTMAASSKIDIPTPVQRANGFVGEVPETFSSTALPTGSNPPFMLSRAGDSEAKILNNIAAKLGNNTSATGTINLITERAPCASCSNIIEKFKAKYPNINLNVFDNGGANIPPTRKSP
jgi:The  BURPS668_1122 family of deaminases